MNLSHRRANALNEVNKNYILKHQDILSFRDLSENTISTYTSYLTAFLAWVEETLAATEIIDIPWEEIRSYFRYLKEVKGLNSKTVNVHIAQLRDFFQYVLHKDWDRYQVPFMRTDEYLPAVPTVSEVNAIIDALKNPKHKAQMALLYSSGIRVSELCRLRCQDIYVSKNCIYISKSKNRSDRYAVLSEKALSHLTAYIRNCHKGAEKTDWLFPGKAPGTHISTHTIYLILIRTVAALGWEGRGFTLHSLRHAFGLHLYEAGCDLISIKEAMGHRSLSSTTIYLTLGIGNGRSVTSPYDL